ncbi:hypothetical protein [Sedimentimonas flavescens]|uniref:hypothetical protein n=1 Tax=Sedimentimonas flavescens TaxID=2851012 RepID=UPI001C4A5D2E|nr:hypothetical protein [Sedimentimonas flavescens]MBW0157606.1 hypothetical protein [Sedimentimonas flavescens]
MPHQPLYERLENAILIAVRRGRCLAEDWSEHGPEPSDSAPIQETLARLREGEVLARHDDITIQSMGKALCAALNALKPGYGDLCLMNDTSDHLIFEAPREHLRQLIECWKALRDVRQEVRDLVAAMRALEAEIHTNA